jgi:hypothetical protein
MRTLVYNQQVDEAICTKLGMTALVVQPWQPRDGMSIELVYLVDSISFAGLAPRNC